MAVDLDVKRHVHLERNASMFVPVTHSVVGGVDLANFGSVMAVNSWSRVVSIKNGARVMRLMAHVRRKLVDGSIQNIERDTIVTWEVEFTEIDPQVLQSMGEKAVKKCVEKIGESSVWGPEQEVPLLRFDDWEGEYVKIEDGEHIVEEIDRFAEEGQVAGTETAAIIDWNEVELDQPTDLVITPMHDIEMTKLFGIPVDVRHKERGESSLPANADEDVDGQLMEEAANDVDDAHDDELVHVYDKENRVIAVGKLFPSMD
ncbi:hypothetical protein D1007_47136 [Hordeum vulgare]|nr:hypothetical protein D1007_47136 [Hordeum vulgare]